MGLFDVGGYRLWLEGAGAGRPTVVLDAGGNSASDTWEPVFLELASVTRVCRYDRAGLGRSERRSGFATLRRMAEELRSLVTAANEPGPYLLVGHSLGAMVARVFAGLFPADVAGLVLVAPGHEDQLARYAAVLTYEQAHAMPWRSTTANPEGFSPVEWPEVFAAACTAGRRLPNVPLVVVANDAGQRFPADWPAKMAGRVAWELQAEQATLIARGKLVTAAASGHDIQRDQPDLVVAAILDTVGALRSSPADRPGI